MLRVYKSDENFEIRQHFRSDWGELLVNESEPYRESPRFVTDEQHCAVISKISEQLSSKFGQYLAGDRLRFGTSQKAFNLYLKYLWAMDEIAMPPHCPVDSVVLARIGIFDSWTQCDSCEQYMGWINAIRKRLSLAEWENEAWLRWRIENSAR